MKTAERLAHLSDVLTPSYAKDADTQSNQPDANSIESLLLNLANNEMQVQQQKVHAHMPRKPTRMKLLYEDHAQSVSVRSSSAMSTYKEPKPSVPKTKLPRPPLPPTPQRAHKSDVSSQAGLWSSRSSLQSANNSFTSFTSSIESMHEQSVRTEVGQSRASSMLFGPRGMPGSRSSSRVQDYAQSSLASLYSVSDNSASQTRTDHEAAISEARQLLDGIPSPTEHGVSSHEADYLFDDIDDDKDVDSKL
ncbi:hypothetical protein GGH97_006447, partial [Coemansia sp. RSA 475]